MQARAHGDGAEAAAERAERDAAALKDVADALTQSKGALQRTMVEQLGAMRAQLDRAQVPTRAHSRVPVVPLPGCRGDVGRCGTL